MAMTMNGAFAAWGPALLICLTVVIGILYNNARINDLAGRLDSRVNDVNSRIDTRVGDAVSRMSDLRSYMDARFNGIDRRFDDLKDFIKSEVRRLEDRQSPIHRA